MAAQSPVLFLGGIVADINISGLDRFPQPETEFTLRSDVWHGQPAHLLVGAPAANAAVVYSALAGPCAVGGPIGRDALGDFLADALTSRDIDVVGERVSTTATHTIAVGHDGRRQAYCYPGEHIDLGAIALAWSGGHLYLTALALAVDRPIVPGARAAAAVAHAAGGLTVLDIGQAGPEMLDLDEISQLDGAIDIVIGNAYEFQLVLDHPYEEARLRFREGFHGAVIVKLGAEGVVLDSGPDEELIAVPGFPVEAVNPIGAGDSFGGGLMAALCRGATLVAACKYANAVGAASVSSALGPEGVTAERVNAVLRTRDPHEPG